MQNEEKRLDDRLEEAVKATIEREDKIESLMSLWKEVRAQNNFRKSLEELFSGE